MPEAQDIQVLIAGAGLGGLALAQSLRRAGIVVRVFERDSSPWDRPQGYRLHLDADAIGALDEVLPPQLHAVFEATAQRTEPYTTILDTDLSVIKRLPMHDDVGDVWPARRGAAEHCNVDRATLRQIPLAGLDDAVEYDRKLVAHESRADGVVAHFEDGSTAAGSVLVGADGIRSIVRALRAPNCETADAGILAIYGRIPIDQAETLVPPETLGDIFTIASDNRKVFLGLGSVRFPMPPIAPANSSPPRRSSRWTITWSVSSAVDASSCRGTIRRSRPRRPQTCRRRRPRCWLPGPRGLPSWSYAATRRRSSWSACTPAFPACSTPRRM